MNSELTQKDPKLARLLGFLSQDPENDRLRGEVFQVALESGDFAEAAYHLATAREARPGEAAWRQREAHLALAQGRFAEAQDLLLELVDQSPDEPSFRWDLAYTHFALKAFAPAQEAAARLIEDPAVGALAFALWLRCAHHLGQLKEGLEAFTAALTHRSMSAEAYGVASLMAFDAFKAAEARSWSALALQAEPGQHEALVVQGSLALGRAEAPAALALFQRALDHHPVDGRTWSGLAFGRFLALDFPGALHAFRQAVTFMPDHVGTWIGYGWCQVMAGELPAALATFEHAVALDRNFAESHGALAVALARLNQRAEAEREIEIALKLDPKSLSARYAQAILTGEADNSAAFQRMAQRVLAQHPAPGEEPGGLTLADVVLRYTKR